MDEGIEAQYAAFAEIQIHNDAPFSHTRVIYADETIEGAEVGFQRQNLQTFPPLSRDSERHTSVPVDRMQISYCIVQPSQIPQREWATNFHSSHHQRHSVHHGCRGADDDKFHVVLNQPLKQRLKL
ncbi:MAG TPA: hypothetical protein VMP11_05700 [Verrucomicrobiae bacterium]|nr:hypothetical protein [Verrucomicrobiae bacterium]